MALGKRCKLCVPYVIVEDRWCIITSPSVPVSADIVSVPACLGHRHVQPVVVRVQDHWSGVSGVGPGSYGVLPGGHWEDVCAQFPGWQVLQGAMHIA